MQKAPKWYKTRNKACVKGNRYKSLKRGITILIELTLNPFGLTTVELMQKLRVRSSKTIYRLIISLQECNVPIYTDFSNGKMRYKLGRIWINKIISEELERMILKLQGESHGQSS